VQLLQNPELERFEGVVSFIDISGFTTLSEALAKTYGTEGAEMLNKAISGYFARLIEIVFIFGGDILKFAGDAMLVMWRNPRNGEGMNANMTLRMLLESAITCNLLLLKRCCLLH
jgi:class 3 adenylate cyclase